LVWKDGSAVKSTDCSSSGHEFKSQQPHGGSQPSVMRSDALFWSVSEDSYHVFIYNKYIFIIARSWKEPRCPSTEEWIQKMWYIYTMEYYSAIENDEFMKFLGKWIELENINLSEVTQLQKNTHGVNSLISGY
jgi:hypothetical protein